MHPRSSTVARGRSRRFSAFPFLVAAGVGCCLALAGCGGSGSGDPGGEASSQRAAEQTAVKFAKCLREHGLNAETSNGPDGKGFGIHISGVPHGPHGKEEGPASGPPPQFQAAMSDCKRYAPKGPLESLSPAQKAEEKQKALEFARCMRSHGVEVPDPGASGVLELNNIDPQSATFQSAQNACHHLMGNLPLAIRASQGAPGHGFGGGQESSTSGAAPSAGGGGE
jgi:hypothetical protein